MNLEQSEIEAIGDAIVSLSYVNYSTEQQKFVSDFLNDYARELNAETIKVLFKDRNTIIEALQSLHTFSRRYESQNDIIREFNDELDELLINLNGNRGQLII